MKEWFKYEYGYVNLDDQNLYLTNSGNWSDTVDLKEQDKTKKNHFPSKGIIYLIMVAILFSALFFMNVISGKMSMVLLIGLPLAGIAVYNYMKSEIGANYRIPYSKINSIEISGETVTINFNDLNNAPAICELKNVSPEGLRKMDVLKKMNLLN